MRRLLAAVALLVVAGVAVADVAPPKGLKRVPLDHKITTEKEYSDYVFYTVIGGGKNVKVSEIKLDPKTPAVIAGAGRNGISRLGQFVAVPKDAGKKYGSEKEFHAAIAEGKVEGQVKSKLRLDSFTTVKDTDTRTTVTTEYALDKIDPKEGLVITEKGEDTKPAPKTGGSAPPSKGGEEEEESVAAGYAPQGGAWVAGLGATAAVVFAGLWLVRRGRRELA